MTNLSMIWNCRKFIFLEFRSDHHFRLNLIGRVGFLNQSEKLKVIMIPFTALIGHSIWSSGTLILILSPNTVATLLS